MGRLDVIGLDYIVLSLFSRYSSYNHRLAFSCGQFNNKFLLPPLLFVVLINAVLQ